MSELLNEIYINTFTEGRFKLLMEGLFVTLQISLGAILLGVLIGFIVVSCRLSETESNNIFLKIFTKILKILARIYLNIIRGTPVVVQLFIIALTIFKTSREAGIWIAIVTFGLNSAAYIAEIIRAGILSIDKGQTEAGRSLGLTKSQTSIFIVIPQAIKNILPALVNEFIALIKETAVIGYIAVDDLFHSAQQIQSLTFSVVPYFVAAIIYLIVINILILFMNKLEAKIRVQDVK